MEQGARPLKALIIGSGGREHALAWKLAQSQNTQLFAAPGNPGIAQIANTLNTTDYLALAQKFRPDLTIVGPEAPLVAGIVDQFRAHNLPIVGPTAAAAQLESSKAFAKSVMDQAHIPTARYQTAHSPAEAHSALKAFGFPVVLKADGLAAGKGVVIAHTAEEAETALHSLFALSRRLLIEEFLQGEEVSFMVLTDGTHHLPLEPTQDHKTIHDNDQGPNTGGMGAYCDSRILSAGTRAQILDTVIEPALHTMRANGTPFTGFLYAGLMLTPDGPRVLEFNARLGDPESQAILHRLDSDLLPALDALAHGDLRHQTLPSNPDPSVCVVLAAHGYPGTVRTGDPIQGIEHVQHATVFQAGTKVHEQNLQTAGGRVLGVTASGPTLPDAIATAYREVRHIHFEGMQYRKDIGQKGLKRW
jgi:phosphoribosylamine--glycine ligase